MAEKKSLSSHQVESELRESRPPIFVFTESKFPEAFAHAAFEEIQNVQVLSNRQIKVAYAGNQSWGEGELSSTDKYVSAAQKRDDKPTNLGYGTQVNVETIFDLFEGHFSTKNKLKPQIVFMIDKDLKGHKVDWGFGLTDANTGLEVVSARRFLEGSYAPELAMEMWRRLVRHETAHLFGLVNRKIHVEEKLGTHCTNICCMRQGMDMKSWEKLTREENEKNITFCVDCITELRG